MSKEMSLCSSRDCCSETLATATMTVSFMPCLLIRSMLLLAVIVIITNRYSLLSSEAGTFMQSDYFFYKSLLFIVPSAQ